MSKYKKLIYYLNIFLFNSLPISKETSTQNEDVGKSCNRSGEHCLKKNIDSENKLRHLFGWINAPIETNTAKFVFYYGPSFADSKSFPLSEATKILQHRNFDFSKKTVLYIHGYLENVKENNVNIVVDAYLERSDYNILVLDWSSLTEGRNYVFNVIVNINQFALELADALIQMFNDGLNISKFHLVGHSLGCQLSGIVGREISKKTNGNLKLSRITALDPAYPGYYFIKFGSPLYKSDAKFIDVIHTDAGYYGVPFSTGTVDFWPNGGKSLQPGCTNRNYELYSRNDLCSHSRSWLYWAESVSGKYEISFNAVKANSWSDFLQGKVDDSSIEVVMGNDCPTNVHGDYYLQTNAASPFARGFLGKKLSKTGKANTANKICQK